MSDTEALHVENLNSTTFSANSVPDKALGIEIFEDFRTVGNSENNSIYTSGDGNVPDALSDTETIHIGNLCSTSTTFRVDSVPDEALGTGIFENFRTIPSDDGASTLVEEIFTGKDSNENGQSITLVDGTFSDRTLEVGDSISG